MRWLAIGAVLFYQIALRRFLRRTCLFEVTCSRYAINSFRSHGFITGLRLTRERLKNCQAPAAMAWTVDPNGRAELLFLEAEEGVEWERIPERLLSSSLVRAPSAKLIQSGGVENGMVSSDSGGTSGVNSGRQAPEKE